MKRIITFVIMIVLLAGVLPAQSAVGQTCSASVVVVNNNDSGAGSLRQALIDVCPDGLVTFDENLSGVKITLASQLTIDKNVTIEGDELVDRVTLDADNLGRVLEVNSGVTAALNNLRITHGNVTGSGGGILNYGDLTVVETVLFSNSSSQNGGGIYNHDTGTLTITNSSFVSNSCGTGFSGGGIHNAGSLTITDSNLELNSASANGGAIYNYGMLSMANSTLSQNSAAVDGGGIFNSFGATATLNGCTLSLNTAVNGGGISINESGDITVRDSTFSENAASSKGGGIFIASNGTGEVIGSTFVNNSAGTFGGGGIKNFGSMSVANSTFTGNTTTATGNYGSAIDNTISGTQMTLQNSTFSGNSGPFTLINANGATLNYANTILADTVSGYDCFNYAGTIGTNTNNLVEADVEDLCAASLSDDPMLDPLADNGGATQTMALLEGSPAIDAGDNAICGGTLVGGVDQRGVERPQGSACDIGAYEVINYSSFIPLIFVNAH